MKEYGEICSIFVDFLSIFSLQVSLSKLQLPKTIVLLQIMELKLTWHKFCRHPVRRTMYTILLSYIIACNGSLVEPINGPTEGLVLIPTALSTMQCYLELTSSSAPASARPKFPSSSYGIQLTDYQSGRSFSAKSMARAGYRGQALIYSFTTI